MTLRFGFVTYMRGTRRLNQFFKIQITRCQWNEVLSFSPGVSLVALYGWDMGWRHD